MPQLPKKNSRPSTLPSIPYRHIREAVLGRSYELSVVSVSPAEALALNKKYRKKSYIPDALAFPLSKNEGEIVLNIEAIAREAKKHDVSRREFATRLFVHACLHLKGFTHGPRMEKEELRFLKKLDV